jgi:integral membrane sensor domain MASE1
VCDTCGAVSVRRFWDKNCTGSMLHVATTLFSPLLFSSFRMPRAAACANTCSITFNKAVSFAHSSSATLTSRQRNNNNFAHFNVITAYVRRNVPRALRGDIRTFERHRQL